MRRWIGFFLLMTTVSDAVTSLPYSTLSAPLVNNAKLVDKLADTNTMAEDSRMLKQYVSSIAATVNVGEEISSIGQMDEEVARTYLRQLRDLAATKEKIEFLYRKKLQSAMQETNIEHFEELVNAPLEIVHQPRIRSDVIAFYEKNFPKNSIQSIESLREEQQLEVKSIQMAIEQEQAYEEHLRTLKRSEVIKVKKGIRLGSRNSVLLSSESDGRGGYELEAENLNPYTVTMSIDFDTLHNLQPSARLPLFIEIPPNSAKKVLELKRIVQSVNGNFHSSYGWVRGSPFAVHTDDYLYGLPFAKGSVVFVSQGYHGETSHKGLSAYAVDFPVPEGTAVYAAREGTVVGAEGSNTLGAPSPEYRQYANYVIVEHADGTMGNYYHLKNNGVFVKIGQKIQKGELLGYSGNTGYSSGPHLHFSVSKVDPVSMRRPMNLPIKMNALEGIVLMPRKGDRYTVQ